MTYGYIYKIEFPNGKHYIGQTISLKHRQGSHKCAAKSGDTKCLYNALRKYKMEDTFELIEIDTADTPEELCEKEIQYIQEYNSYYKDKNGYNMTFGGDGMTGHVHTEESKKKQSETMKKLYESTEVRQKMSEAQKKYHEDNPDVKKQRSEAKKIYYEDNPEIREQIGKSLEKYYNEHPEAGKAHGEKVKKYHEKNPNAGKEHSKALYTYYKNNPEAIKQASERTKKQFECPQARRFLADAKGKNKPFDIFTKDGLFIKTFTYQFEARGYLQKEHHITSSIRIGAVLSGQLKTSAGFVFKYR